MSGFFGRRRRVAAVELLHLDLRTGRAAPAADDVPELFSCDFN